MEEKQIQLFACAINLHPFINNGEQKVVLKHLPNPGACGVILLFRFLFPFFGSMYHYYCYYFICLLV